MASIGYEGLETHRHIHKEFRENTLPVLEQELEETDYNPDSVNHFLGVCAGWLIGHTLTEDRAITGQTVSRWVNLLPEEELEEMISQAYQDEGLDAREAELESQKSGLEDGGPRGPYRRGTGEGAGG